MATWPSTLPSPSYDGYALSPVSQVIRTDMEVGAARQRRRTSARQDKVAVTWKFTDAQMTIFRAWFDDATNGAAGGSGWFTISLAVGATGLTSMFARFVGGEFKADLHGGLNWLVSANLEVQP
jgi:hypothetical protein